MNDNASSPKNQRPIRSFVRRLGRMTTSQEKGLTNYWKDYGIDVTDQPIDFEKAFKRHAPMILEIGFGMGHSLLAQAKTNPDTNFIGIEVHRPGVGSVLIQLHNEQIANIRIICADAIDILQKNIPDQSLDKIQIFFPDPWPKKKHHKRRLIQTDFIALIARKLKPNGLIHLATDWEDYAMHMLQIMQALNNFIQVPVTEERPTTKFELRGKKLGHQVWDFVFRLQ